MLRNSLIFGRISARPAGLEPATSGLESIFGGLAQGSNELQVTETVRAEVSDRVQRVARKAAIHAQLVTTLLQATPEKAAKARGKNADNTVGRGSVGGRTCLMTVREVAAALRVCTATVYSMIERGELEHVRVSNAIRVVVWLFP